MLKDENKISKHKKIIRIYVFILFCKASFQYLFVYIKIMCVFAFLHIILFLKACWQVLTQSKTKQKKRSPKFLEKLFPLILKIAMDFLESVCSKCIIESEVLLCVLPW